MKLSSAVRAEPPPEVGFLGGVTGTSMLLQHQLMRHLLQAPCRILCLQYSTEEAHDIDVLRERLANPEDLRYVLFFDVHLFEDLSQLHPSVAFDDSDLCVARAAEVLADPFPTRWRFGQSQSGSPQFAHRRAQTPFAPVQAKDQAGIVGRVLRHDLLVEGPPLVASNLLVGAVRPRGHSCETRHLYSKRRGFETGQQVLLELTRCRFDAPEDSSGPWNETGQLVFFNNRRNVLHDNTSNSIQQTNPRKGHINIEEQLVLSLIEDA
mmetsp:Transcript_67846/g.141820  ORF Transcript_67846/g.141820 Transcript_67846/m.141820 type:complete len:265 (-) Transcript_67846:246-1040(-)